MGKMHIINDHIINDNLEIRKRLELSHEIGYKFGLEGDWYGLNSLVLRENFNYSDEEIEAYSTGFSKGRQEYFELISESSDAMRMKKILRKQLLHQ